MRAARVLVDGKYVFARDGRDLQGERPNSLWVSNVDSTSSNVHWRLDGFGSRSAGTNFNPQTTTEGVAMMLRGGPPGLASTELRDLPLSDFSGPMTMSLWGRAPHPPSQSNFAQPPTYGLTGELTSLTRIDTPEPTSLALLALSGAGLMGYRWRRR